MNRGRQCWAFRLGLSCWGKASSGVEGMWCALAAAPPLSSSKYSSENARMVDAQTLPPACSRAEAELVSGPPWMRSSMSWIVDQIALRASTLMSATETARSAADRRVIRPGSAVISVTKSRHSMIGSTPAGRQAKVVGQEKGQHHRSHNGRGHRPAGLGVRRLSGGWIDRLGSV